MRTITVSEFRKNIKKYAVLANTEKVIVNRGDGKAFAIVPIEALEDNGYDPEFVKKILMLINLRKRAMLQGLKMPKIYGQIFCRH
ncbi:type II toxin-antitoxin system Phd/YefM family antitoxin [Dyadobacter sp. NIV53]|uniref:type II toxin-antitoxin system Phd/YefM family antitoxin n=1 Tax=Dyadobacter sp. NIV53 TaxID=2861765 RepID=UPI001C86A104|nr:type II toxin-antitoxin system Phd/YefM family antitoxin [Dyadobacter sp. NIV53]